MSFKYQFGDKVRVHTLPGVWKIQTPAPLVEGGGYWITAWDKPATALQSILRSDTMTIPTANIAGFAYPNTQETLES